MVAGVVDATSVADPAVRVAHAEQMVGVGEGDHAGHVHHQAAADVAWVADRMGALFTRDRKLVGGRHAHDDATRVGVDDQDIVQEETAGPVGGVSDEIGMESHGGALWRAGRLPSTETERGLRRKVSVPDSKQLSRRHFLKQAAAGTAIVALGAWYLLDDELTAAARAQTLPDGRPRLPPGQRVLTELRPMGGQMGSASLEAATIRVHGAVDHPFEVSFRELHEMPQTALALDVHCVTGWSVLGARFEGVRLTDLAERAGVKDTARHVIFEAAHGYTANVPLRHAMRDDVLVAHSLGSESLPRRNGGPLRNVVPSLYFWKSAKWLTGIRFVARDAPGYWETRGYHNLADPWREQRYG